MNKLFPTFEQLRNESLSWTSIVRLLLFESCILLYIKNKKQKQIIYYSQSYLNLFQCQKVLKIKYYTIATSSIMNPVYKTLQKSHSSSNAMSSYKPWARSTLAKRQQLQTSACVRQSTAKKLTRRKKIDLKYKNMVPSTHMDLQYHCTHLVDRHEDDYWKTWSNIQFNCKHD